MRDVNHEPFQSVRIFDTVEYLDFEKRKCTEKTWKIWHVELLIFQKISFGTFGHGPIKSRVYFLVAILNSLHLNIVQRNSQRILPTYDLRKTCLLLSSWKVDCKVVYLV